MAFFFYGLSFRGLLISFVYLFVIFRFYNNNPYWKNTFLYYMCLFVPSIVLSSIWLLGKYISHKLYNQ